MEDIRTDTVKVLLILLRAGLWEKEPEDLSLFPLSVSDWEAVFRLAQCQTVTGLVWQGVLRLPEPLLPPESLLLRWVAKADDIERKNRRMNAAVAELYRLFQENGLHPVLQKGQGVARLYEQPLLRECGDIDLYFPDKDEWTNAVSLIRKQGITLQGEADGSLLYRWNGIGVEHHPRLTDISNPFRRKYLQELEQTCGFQDVPLSDENGSKLLITIPSPTLELLLINAHIMKHAFGWGVGLRQLCDMARACYHYRNILQPDEMERIYHRLGIGKWSCLLHSFLTDYLGLPPSCWPYADQPVNTLPLLELVIEGGNFGLHTAGKSRLEEQQGWKRKRNTSYALLNRARFSYSQAPGEAFWAYIHLLIGQKNVKRI